MLTGFPWSCGWGDFLRPLRRRHTGVRSFDLVEMNPRYDTDGHTARSQALTSGIFLKGLSERRA